MDGERRRLRQLEYGTLRPSEATFHPEIGLSSGKEATAARPKLSNRPDESEDEFLNRLVYSKMERMRAVEDLQARQADQPLDPKTGQPLFRPKIDKRSAEILSSRRSAAQSSSSAASAAALSSSSLLLSSSSDSESASASASLRPSSAAAAASSSSSSAKMDIGEYLYSSRFDLEDVHLRLRERQRQATLQMSNKSYASEASLRLVEELKQKRLRALFDCLDSDGDGEISSSHLNVDGLSVVVTREVESVLLADESRSLNFESFVAEMEKHLRESQIAVGSFLKVVEDDLKGKMAERMPSEMREATFKPHLDPHSEKIASRRRDASKPIHDVLLKERDKILKKREKMVNEKRADEMRECTFDPFAAHAEGLGGDIGGSASH